MALTNISSIDIHVREQIVANGAWAYCTDILKAASHQGTASDRLTLAACELMANLSLAEQITKRAENG